MLKLDPSSTALVLIDVQGGILGMPMAPHTPADIVAASVKLASAAKAAGALVIYVRVAFSPDGPVRPGDMPGQVVDQKMTLPPGGLPPAWTELAPDLAAITPDLVITKRQWSAFHGTELDLQCRRRGIRTIVLGGIMTNFGVEGTARDGWQHGYEMVVAEDAISAFDADMHRMSVEKIMPRIARIRSVAEVVTALA